MPISTLKIVLKGPPALRSDAALAAFAVLVATLEDVVVATVVTAWLLVECMVVSTVAVGVPFVIPLANPLVGCVEEALDVGILNDVINTKDDVSQDDL